jgi:hypothetical protein
MASRQAVLLTPLESFHPRSLPSRHRIKRVHPVFCKKQLFSFHALAGTHFATLLFSISCRDGGYPPSRQKSCSIFGQERGLSFSLSLLRIPRRMRILSPPAAGESKGSSPCSRRFSPDFVLSLSLLDATLTRHPISVHSKGLTEKVTPLDATLTKNGGRGYTALPYRSKVLCPIPYLVFRIGQTTTPSLAYTISVLFSPLCVRGIAHSSRVGGPHE